MSLPGTQRTASLKGWFGVFAVLVFTFRALIPIIAPTGTVSVVLRANHGAVSGDRLRAVVETSLNATTPSDLKP